MSFINSNTFNNGNANRSNNNYGNSMATYFPNAKRPRFTNNNMANMNTSNNNEQDYQASQINQDTTKVTPSYVVHVRNLCEGCAESDVRKTLEKYGLISYLIMIPKKRQALIEFCDITSAISCVNDSNRKKIVINGSPAYINYSSEQKIERIKDANDRITENSILLFTITNAIYKIDVNVLKKICTQFVLSPSKLLKIVIMKTGQIKSDTVQAMVEFETMDEARVTKSELNGADIYTGCCSLKVEYAATAKLNVARNDNDNYDSTLENSNSNTQKIVSNNQNDFKNSQNNKQFNFSNSSNATSVKQNSIPSLMSSSSIPTLSMPNNRGLNNTLNNSNDQMVIMVFNLCIDKFNCDRLFNLLCLYGNVDKIKFLMTKEGSAMVQMSNADLIHKFFNSLNNTYAFGKKLQLSVSKQNVLNPVIKPNALADGTPSYKDYSSSRNNRYQNHEAAQKNKPIAPSNILHWFNAPPGFTDQDLAHIFLSAGASPPCKVKVFPKKSEKCSTGLAEWNSIIDSTDALILTNHFEINHPSSKFPYVLKLCYSAAPIIDT